MGKFASYVLLTVLSIVVVTGFIVIVVTSLDATDKARLTKVWCEEKCTIYKVKACTESLVVCGDNSVIERK